MCFNKIISTSRFALMFAALGLTTSLSTTAVYASSATEQQLNQVPGYYRFAVGDAKITALYDGYINLSPKLLKGMESKDIQTLLSKMFMVENKDGVQTAVNAYLIKRENDLILIDAGTGKCFGPTLGNIADNVKAAGYSPTEVKTVLLTHLHADHACGLVSAEGETLFPNATVMVSEEDKDFWLNPAVVAASPEEFRPVFKMAEDSVTPYIKKGQFKTFKSGDNILPGIDSLLTAGHTPGHTAFMLTSNSDKMLFWGDIVHSHSVQFAHPEVSIEFDTDAEKAVKTRKDIFEKAAHGKWLVGGAHLPFPGMGHVRKESSGYAWVPVEYAPVATNK